MSEEETPLPILFHDVDPILQADGPTPVCAISYKQEFIEAMNYFRAVLRSSEKSARALQLTSRCLKLNPANYTVWHYRRQCLFSSKGSSCLGREKLKEDLKFAETLGGSNPKNYQIWYHRRALLEPTLDIHEGEAEGKEEEEEVMELAKEELEYINGVLANDGKNYHAWSHRQWVLRTISFPLPIYTSELSYLHTLLLEDPRNNSAWNHRWFVTHRGSKHPLSEKETKEECHYALQCVEVDPFNESPWRYLIGLLQECRDEDDAFQELLKSMLQKITQLRGNLGSTEYDVDSCVHLTSAKIDILEMKGDTSSLEEAANLANDLGTQHDLIRKKYWRLRENEIRLSLGKATTV